jgi:hypothetical protein
MVCLRVYMQADMVSPGPGHLRLYACSFMKTTMYSLTNGEGASSENRSPDRPLVRGLRTV